MILFTTVTGAAQGLLLSLVAVDGAARTGLIAPPAAPFFTGGALIVLVLCALGLVAAAFHLGRPMRGWRAMAMWRTSWLSREVIVLPMFMAVVAVWGLSHYAGRAVLALGLLAALLALLLYLCTGMIYGAVKAIREWATPMTPLNYTLLGIASGTLLATAWAAASARPLMAPLAGTALAFTVLGALSRGLTFWRNLHAVPKTTVQTAIGVRHPRIVQTSQGMTHRPKAADEFVHGRSDGFVSAVRWAAGLAGFVIPAVVLLAAGAALSALAATLLFVLQYVGLLAERWSFFAEGQHPQNLYHQSRQN
jgi:DMSO reductase anchor subunit